MKKSLSQRAVETALLYAAVCALLYEMFKAFVMPAVFTALPWPLLLFCGALLWPLGLFAASRAAARVVLACCGAAVWLAAMQLTWPVFDLFAVLLPFLPLLAARRAPRLSFWLTGAVGGAGALLLLWRLPALLRADAAALSPYLFYILTAVGAFGAYFAVRVRPLGPVALAAAGCAGFAYLGAVGFSVRPASVVVFCTAMGALLLHGRLAAFWPRKGRRLAFCAVFCAAALLLAQAGARRLDGLSVLQQGTSTRLQALQDWLSGASDIGFDGGQTRTLGGSLRQNNTAVMQVTGNAPFYLKGRNYDVYKNGSWQATDTTPETGFEKSHMSSAWDFLQQYSVMGADTDPQIGGANTVTADAFLNIGSVVDTRTLTVRALQRQMATLFLPLGGVVTSGVQSAYVKSAAGNYRTLEHPLQKGKSYTVGYTWMNLDSEYMIRVLHDYQDYFSAYTAYMQNNGGDYANWQQEQAEAATETRLPATVTARTRMLAQELTAGAGDAITAALAIQVWLKKNCTYSTAVSALPAKAEFVDDFLFRTRKGYCVQFATAMAVLLRAAGYPARYAEGYVSPGGSGQGTYTVTGNQAHAWVEVYSSLFGYVTIDATPGFGTSSAAAVSSAAPSAVSSGASSATVSAAVSSAAPSAVSSGTARRAAGGENAAPPVWVIVLGAVGVLALALGLRLLAIWLWFARQRRRDAARSVIALYGWCLRYLARLGLPCARNETPEPYAARVGAALGLAGFAEMTAVYEQARYGAAPPAPSACAAAVRFCRALPKAAAQKRGKRAAWRAFFLA